MNRTVAAPILTEDSGYADFKMSVSEENCVFAMVAAGVGYTRESGLPSKARCR